MNTQAIEAGAIAVYNHDQPNHQAWPYDTADDWAKDGLRLRAQLVIEAARPHLETEIRAQIAEEIRDAKKTGLTRTEAYGWHNNALEKAAQIAEGKQ